MAPAKCKCAPSADRVRVVPSAIRSAVAIVPFGPAIKPLRGNRVPTHVPTHVRIIVRIPVRRPVPIRGARFRIVDMGRIVRAADSTQTKETGATRLIVRAVGTNQTKEIGAMHPIGRVVLTPIRADRVVRRFVRIRDPVAAPPGPDLPSGVPGVRPPGSRRVVILNPCRMRNRSRSPRSLRCSVPPGPPVRRSPSPFTTASSSASPRAIPPHLRRAHRVRRSVVTMRNPMM